MGFEVAITMGHTKEIDIFASKGNRKISVDVKGVRQPPFLIRTIEDYPERHYFIFVWWREFNNIEKTSICFIAPSERVVNMMQPVERWRGKTSTIKRRSLLSYQNKWEFLDKEFRSNIEQDLIPI